MIRRINRNRYLGEIPEHAIDRIPLAEFEEKISAICKRTGADITSVTLDLDAGGRDEGISIQIEIAETESDKDFETRKKKVAEITRKRCATRKANKAKKFKAIDEMSGPEAKMKLKMLLSKEK